MILATLFLAAMPINVDAAPAKPKPVRNGGKALVRLVNKVRPHKVIKR